MILYLNPITNTFVNSPVDSTPVLSISATRGDTSPVEVGFVTYTGLNTLASGYFIELGFKQGGQQSFSGAYIASGVNFSYDFSQQYSPLYLTNVAFTGAAVDALFTGVNPVKLIAQLTYGVSGVTKITANSLTLNLFDDLNK